MEPGSAPLLSSSAPAVPIRGGRKRGRGALLSLPSLSTCPASGTAPSRSHVASRREAPPDALAPLSRRSIAREGGAPPRAGAVGRPRRRRRGLWKRRALLRAGRPRRRHVPGLGPLRGGGALPAAAHLHPAAAAAHPSAQRAAARRAADAAAQLPAAGPRARCRCAAASRRHLGLPQPAGAAPGAAAAATADAPEAAAVRTAGAAAAAGAAPPGAAAAAAARLLPGLAAAAAHRAAAAGAQLPEAVLPPRAAPRRPQAAPRRRFPGARRRGAARRARRVGRARSFRARAHGHGAVVAAAIPAARRAALPVRAALPAAARLLPTAPALPAPPAGLAAAARLLRAAPLLPGAPPERRRAALPAAPRAALPAPPAALPAACAGLSLTVRSARARRQSRPAPLHPPARCLARGRLGGRHGAARHPAARPGYDDAPGKGSVWLPQVAVVSCAPVACIVWFLQLVFRRGPYVSRSVWSAWSCG